LSCGSYDKPIDNPNKYDQYVLKPIDKEKIKHFINEPVNDIVRYEKDLPF